MWKPRFRLRAILIVTGICCLPLAWIAHNLSLPRRHERLVSELQQQGCDVIRTSELHGKPLVRQSYAVRLFTGDLIEPVARVDFRQSKQVTPELAGRIAAEFHQLEDLLLRRTTVDDAFLEEIQTIKTLKTLDLDETQVTDAGLRHLAQLPELTLLSLAGTEVSDAGLAELAGLKNLVMLTLNDTCVTNAGLKQLPLAPQSQVNLMNTGMTDDDIEDLLNAKPGISIQFGPMRDRWIVVGGDFDHRRNLRPAP